MKVIRMLDVVTLLDEHPYLEKKSSRRKNIFVKENKVLTVMSAFFLIWNTLQGQSILFFNRKYMFTLNVLTI